MEMNTNLNKNPINDKFQVYMNNIQTIIPNLQKMVVNPLRVSQKIPQMKYNIKEKLMRLISPL
jgi:hypothetical protein